MNKLRPLLFFTAITIICFCSALRAQAQLERLYFKADLGGNITLDTDLREFFGPVTPGSKVRFEPGLRAGFGVGYDLTDFFAFEGEFGVMENHIDSITDATRNDAWFSQVPFLVNVKLKLPNSSIITPYIGGGVGGSAAILDIDEIALNGNFVHGSDSDVVFAYQAFGGLRVRINERMGLSVEYRYFATDAPTWHSDDIVVGSDSIRFGRGEVHAFSLAFDYHF